MGRDWMPEVRNENHHKQMKPRLCLDLSFKCVGWASLSALGLASGRESFPVPKGADPAIRYCLYRDWLRSMLDTHSIEEVVYEEIVPGGRGQSTWKTRDVMVGLKTITISECALRGIAYSSLWPSTIKKLATGDGRSKKPEMVKMAKSLFSYYEEKEDDGGDEADALLILHIKQRGLDKC